MVGSKHFVKTFETLKSFETAIKDLGWRELSEKPPSPLKTFLN